MFPYDGTFGHFSSKQVQDRIDKFAVLRRTGYEEVLFQTPDGLYFVYVNGGEDSIHPTEDISRISKAKVEQWLAEHI